MRVLHLFSNSKWTGPAEPALNLCVALRARGVEADFACAEGGGSSINKVVETARDRGLEPVTNLYLGKHRRPIQNLRARGAIARLLAAKRYDLIHCHMDNDHLVALAPARKAGIPVVRTSYHGEGFPENRRHAGLLARTARLIEPSAMALEKDVARGLIARERACVVPNAVDVHRFDPARETPDGRRWLKLPPEAFVVGIVARMQTHRHFEDLFQAFRTVVDAHPAAHLVVVGRGTKQEQVGFAPVTALGLEEHVHFPGFIEGENYVGMLRGFDAAVFLVPGSDGTCRAVREIMAMGKPVVAADRGMLREIVTHGENGIIVDGPAEGLAKALCGLAGNRVERRRMGRAAREKAVRAYSLEHQAEQVASLYADLR